ncbi:hypothetical protein [Vibrio diazotrophicus]|nr:hypothetical protein [Vibrio diazotrophicus]
MKLRTLDRFINIPVARFKPIKYWRASVYYYQVGNSPKYDDEAMIHDEIG